ncbi:hypothetical protein FAZ19_17700 [Sphingobacterium alkalisoli]|uniref:Uncharacterized protein n=1 Tax=Sphingobacterium alkalisoli TaxID=1874115 RepID=A0A4U0GWN8_9SPHI|nr:hypothetical protein [Sphingobacterium alkalisoli]TJY63416.1 hypothetical protein FAZ19_17700 [Sphingobacterium alkalisoli]GGH25937.1 hypothetical protein GCM10011418_34840 [Sphingobacterium alkalisoli]
MKNNIYTSPQILLVLNIAQQRQTGPSDQEIKNPNEGAPQETNPEVPDKLKNIETGEGTPPDLPEEEIEEPDPESLEIEEPVREQEIEDQEADDIIESDRPGIHPDTDPGGNNDEIF